MEACCVGTSRPLLGKLKSNPRRNYDRVIVEYPAKVRPIHDPSQRIVVEGTLSELSLRGSRVRTSQRIPMGCQVMLEFHPAEYDDPIMIDGAILRSPCAEEIGHRFSSFLRSDERHLRILDLRLPGYTI
ncbi:MAG: PilZ domain-containing protein [Nitrospirota bacterium]